MATSPPLIRDIDTAPPSWLSPSADGADLALDVFPSVMLLAASTLLQRNVTRPFLEANGINLGAWRVLISLNLYGAQTAAGIAARSWMDKAQISRAAAELETARLIRKAVDPAHARRVILTATAAGRKLYARLYAESRVMQVQLLALLSVDERKAIFSGLQKIIRYSEAAG